MISTFHKNYLKKPMATFPHLDSAPPIAKPSVKFAKPSAKQKQGYPTGSTKQAKWNIGQWDFSFLVLVRLESFFTNFMNFGRDAYLASSSNFVNFGRDAHLASSSNSASFLFMSSMSPQCSLSISGTSPPVFWFSFSVSHWIRKFFTRLILRFSSLVSH